MASDWRAGIVLAQTTGTHITDVFHTSLHVCPIITITICHHCLFPRPVAVLSLFEVEVNISLLTNGGRSVTQYTVSGFACVLSRPGREGMGSLGSGPVQLIKPADCTSSTAG